MSNILRPSAARTSAFLAAVDAADGNPCELFEIGDDGTECMTVVRIAVQ
jgi:hypothetical protein